MEARPGRAVRAALPWQPRDSRSVPRRCPPTKWRRAAQNGAGPAGMRRRGGGAQEEGSALCAVVLGNRGSCEAALGLQLLLRHRGGRAAPKSGTRCWRFGVIAARLAERQDRGSGAVAGGSSPRLASVLGPGSGAAGMASGAAPQPHVCPCPSVPLRAAVQSRQR